MPSVEVTDMESQVAVNGDPPLAVAMMPTASPGPELASQEDSTTCDGSSATTDPATPFRINR